MSQSLGNLGWTFSMKHLESKITYQITHLFLQCEPRCIRFYRILTSNYLGGKQSVSGLSATERNLQPPLCFASLGWYQMVYSSKFFHETRSRIFVHSCNETEFLSFVLMASVQKRICFIIFCVDFAKHLRQLCTNLSLRTKSKTLRDQLISDDWSRVRVNTMTIRRISVVSAEARVLSSVAHLCCKEGLLPRI